jgi:cobalamin biosynthesis protein CobC
MNEHGGNLDQAMQRFGGSSQEWIDLSTGINRQAYPVGEVPQECWNALPPRSAIESLNHAARQAYGTSASILAIGGAQAAIGLLPYLVARGSVRILAPTYNEYAIVFAAAGWDVSVVSDLEALAGADLAVVGNPNNPDGKHYDPTRLLSLRSRVGRLVVDESFADAVPDLSLAPKAGQPGLLVLRSFGKFYGLAGLRLGFVIGCAADIAALSTMVGPWPVSGAAITIGQRALADRDWAAMTSTRLACEGVRLDAEVTALGWTLVGGTALFRLYETGEARAAQEKLARAQIWSRIFAGNPGWLRLGLPGNEVEWERLARALKAY